MHTPTTATATAAAAETPEMVSIRIENAYSCGQESEHVVDVPAPAATDEETLTDWWEDCVFEHTGDGHTCEEHTDDEDLDDEDFRQSCNSCYEATIIAASDPALIGLTNEWC